MAQNVTLWGASYSNVPALNVPKTGGGTARFTDTSGTTAVAADVAQGKVFYDSSGAQQTGSAVVPIDGDNLSYGSVSAGRTGSARTGRSTTGGTI